MEIKNKTSDKSELTIQEWRTELNFLRLLSRCENMASKNSLLHNWRLGSFVKHLEEELPKLKKISTNQPSEESLLLYVNHLNFLQGLIKAKKLKSNTLKCQIIDDISELMFIPSTDYISTENKLNTKQLHSQIKSQHHGNLRDELFSKKKDIQTQLKNRNDLLNKRQFEDIKYHQQIHERLEEEMVQMARNLKENASTAGRIVKQDNEKLIEANELASLNMDQLKVESERLEQYLASACNCWLWMSMLIVCLTFVSMVIFMKLFPKKYS